MVIGTACGDDDSADGVPPPTINDSGGASVDAAVGIPDAGITSDAHSGTCNPVIQDCPGPHQKCTIDAVVQPVCIPIGTSSIARGLPCELGECASGLACVRPTETSTQSVCEKICDLSLGSGCAALGPDFDCRVRIDGTEWGACEQLPLQCDPLTQDPCTSEQACQPFLRRPGARDFRCQPAGPGQADERCDGTNPGCARGLVCVSERGGTATCEVICLNDADCASPLRCVGVVDDPPFHYCTQ